MTNLFFFFSCDFGCGETGGETREERENKKSDDFKDTRGINEVARSRIIRNEEVKHILDRQGCRSSGPASTRVSARAQARYAFA